MIHPPTHPLPPPSLMSNHPPTHPPTSTVTKASLTIAEDGRKVGYLKLKEFNSLAKAKVNQTTHPPTHPPPFSTLPSLIHPSIQHPQQLIRTASSSFISSIHPFTHSPHPNKVQDALSSLEDQGAEAYIIDLRGNPGGSVQAAVSVASLFLPEEKVGQGKEIPSPTHPPTASSPKKK